MYGQCSRTRLVGKHSDHTSQCWSKQESLAGQEFIVSRIFKFKPCCTWSKEKVWVLTTWLVPLARSPAFISGIVSYKHILDQSWLARGVPMIWHDLTRWTLASRCLRPGVCVVPGTILSMTNGAKRVLALYCMQTRLTTCCHTGEDSSRSKGGRTRITTLKYLSNHT